jgi:hypothetical protein
MHQGKADSSVFYNACNPSTPYNIESLLSSRDSFHKRDVPIDFRRSQGANEREFEHEDCGARRKNILSEGGMKVMGLERFDENELDLTHGQRESREFANKKLGL